MQFAIPAEVMEPYFRSMKADLTVTRFPTFADLLYYMDGSAAAGRTGDDLHRGRSATDTASRTRSPYADSLSIAMQLSNFWRDVGQDYRIGRVYLPLEDMARFGVTEDDLRDARVDDRFISLMEFEMARTDEYYRHAVPGIKRLAAGRWGVVAALEVYRAIHQAIRRNGYDVFTKRATTTKAQKFGLAVRAQWRLAMTSLRG